MINAGRARVQSRGSSLAPPTMIIAIAVFLIDQTTKSIVRGSLAPCSAAPCQTAHVGPLTIVNVANAGGTLGFGSGSLLWIAMTLLSVVLIPVFGFRLGRLATRSLSCTVGLGLACGGALGNLTDR